MCLSACLPACLSACLPVHPVPPRWLPAHTRSVYLLPSFSPSLMACLPPPRLSVTLSCHIVSPVCHTSCLPQSSVTLSCRIRLSCLFVTLPAYDNSLSHFPFVAFLSVICHPPQLTMHLQVSTIRDCMLLSVLCVPSFPPSSLPSPHVQYSLTRLSPSCQSHMFRSYTYTLLC